MKLAIMDAKKARTGETELPPQFDEPYRADIIRRAVHSLQAAARQPYGSDPEAGKRSSAKLSRRRRNYRGSYGKGISRVPRKIMTRRGAQMFWVGAFAPGTVGGRRAHPPKVTKIWEQKINERENRKAIRSAIGATLSKTLVAARGHKVPADYPFIIDSSFEGFTRTRQLEEALIALGFGEDLFRAAKTHVRAGTAKMRGRRTRRATSLLIVCSTADVSLTKAAANVPGITVTPVQALNAELLAPGTHAGRATLFTEQAIAILKERKLFLDTGKKPQVAKQAGQEQVAENEPARKPAAKSAEKTAPIKRKAPTPKAAATKAVGEVA
jgi:large subunit ribosomal protein L4e